MWVGIEVLDRVAWIPSWAVCVSFGVLIGWFSARRYFRKQR